MDCNVGKSELALVNGAVPAIAESAVVASKLSYKVEVGNIQDTSTSGAAAAAGSYPLAELAIAGKSGPTHRRLELRSVTASEPSLTAR